MTPFLLDVNVMIAILDEDHTHHLRAITWFETAGHQRWLSSPTTENGVLRIMSLPAYPRTIVTPDQVLESLEALRRFGNHAFIADDISLVDSPMVRRSRLAASKQVTDSYLLALAIRHDAILVTFDRRLSTTAIESGDAHLLYLG